MYASFCLWCVWVCMYTHLCVREQHVSTTAGVDVHQRTTRDGSPYLPPRLRQTLRAPWWLPSWMACMPAGILLALPSPSLRKPGSPDVQYHTLPMWVLGSQLRSPAHTEQALSTPPSALPQHTKQFLKISLIFLCSQYLTDKHFIELPRSI